MSLGVMIDCSRDAVMTVDKLKDFITILAKFGYDSVQLYTEDTYEIDGEPYFGYMRGRYTQEEIRSLDKFCNELSVELIPCVQTLAHLNQMLRWYTYADINDVNDILLVDEPKTYEFIDRMFASLANSFSSRRVNIGMDEAHMLGLGKYLNKHGYCDRFDILSRHLSKVVEIASKYGFSPMMWSDMYFRLANKGNYADIGNDASKIWFSKEIADKMPKGVTPVYWDYYSNETYISQMLDKHALFDRPIGFAGGAWTWKGFCPDNTLSLDTMLPAMRVCNQKGVDTVFITMWGDNGGECSRYAVLPSLYAIAQAYHGNEDMAAIKRGFRQIVGEDFDDMMSLDLPDRLFCEAKDIRNPSKYMLYNDILLGQFDSTVSGGENEKYAELATKYKQLASRGGTYACLYNMYYRLADVLSVKYELGVKLRAAYKRGDKNQLVALQNDLCATVDKLKKFTTAFLAVWSDENKPFGLEIHQQRLGGAILRAEYCRDKVAAFVDGKIDKIEELEVDVLDVSCGTEPVGKTVMFNDWAKNVSTAAI